MIRRAFAVAAVLACVPAAAQEPLPPGLHGADRLAALVQRVSQVQSSLTTLTATFEQRRTSKLLAAPSVSHGTFYYKAPDSVRWEYQTPRPMTVLLTGGVAITYRPAEKRAERVEVGRAQKRVLRFLSAAEPLEQLKAYFSFTFRDPGGTANYQLELRPTAHQIKKRLRELDLEIDRQSLLPVKVAYFETDGDGTEYSFSKIEMNQPLSPDLFDLVLPSDVKVVHLKLGSGE
ncbi:MAG TPA: outer membrane lipoprotein carrier protein LolA [Thermoanaerobaculaceae bacterium]|nr:outer membrane lipoprotein carrier protein LolA [Thermoanaerobaculaceae bacterium]